MTAVKPKPTNLSQSQCGQIWQWNQYLFNPAIQARNACRVLKQYHEVKLLDYNAPDCTFLVRLCCRNLFNHTVIHCILTT